MVYQAMARKLELNEEFVEKLGCKRPKRSRHLLTELRDLNKTLIEVYKELEQMTRVAKDMAAGSKQAR